MKVLSPFGPKIASLKLSGGSIRKINIEKYIPLIERLESDGIKFYDSKNEMKKNNFSQDEQVQLSTRRGKVSVKVRFDKMIPDGMVFMPFCFENAPANLLTNQALDPDGKIPELKYCAAKIEKLTA